MKVALCFFGQPRVIKNPYTVQSHYDWIINKYTTDVFAHSWITGTKYQFSYSDWVDTSYHDYEDLNTSNIILNNYNPKIYNFEHPKHFSLNEQDKIKVQHLKYYSLNNENNLLSHLYSLSNSLKLINDIYDWIIISRYDNYIRFMPDLYKLNKDSLYITTDYGNHFPDHLIFGGFRQMSTLNCYDIISNLCDHIDIFTPESFKRAAFYQLGETEQRVHLEVGLARTLTLDKLQI